MPVFRAKIIKTLLSPMLLLVLSLSQAIAAETVAQKMAGDSTELMLRHLTCLATAKSKNPLSDYSSGFRSYEVTEERNPVKRVNTLQFGSDNRQSLCGKLEISNNQQMAELNAMRPTLQQAIDKILQGQPAQNIDVSYFRAAMQGYSGTDVPDDEAFNVEEPLVPVVSSNDKVAIAYAKLARKQSTEPSAGGIAGVSSSKGGTGGTAASRDEVIDPYDDFVAKARPASTGMSITDSSGGGTLGGNGGGGFGSRAGSSSGGRPSPGTIVPDDCNPDEENCTPDDDKDPSDDDKGKDDPYDFPDHDYPPEVYPDAFDEAKREEQLKKWRDQYKAYVRDLAGANPAKPLEDVPYVNEAGCWIDDGLCGRADKAWKVSLGELEKAVDKEYDARKERKMYEQDSKSWLASHLYYCALVFSDPRCYFGENYNGF